MVITIHQHVKTHQMQNPNLLTSFIPLFSLNVLGKSVLISIATISTAFDWRWFFLTKSPLHRTAAALPSDVGLQWSNGGHIKLRMQGRNGRLKVYTREAHESCFSSLLFILPLPITHFFRRVQVKQS